MIGNKPFDANDVMHNDLVSGTFSCTELITSWWVVRVTSVVPLGFLPQNFEHHHQVLSCLGKTKRLVPRQKGIRLGERDCAWVERLLPW